MRYHAFNIGVPPSDAWWARNVGMGIISAGYGNKPGGRGEKIFLKIEKGDWIIAYAKEHGFVGAGIAAGHETYLLMKEEQVPSGFESVHRHIRKVSWVHYVGTLSQAIPISEAGRHAPRQTRELIKDVSVAERLIVMLSERSVQKCDSSPEEVPDGTFYEEGAAERILVDRYERSPEARRECIAHWGCKCGVCGFDFAKRYGALGVGYIHVHHLMPLAGLKRSYRVDPKENLRPVCPNCHAMLHRSNPPLTIEALKNLLGDTVE